MTGCLKRLFSTRLAFTAMISSFFFSFCLNPVCRASSKPVATFESGSGILEPIRSSNELSELLLQYGLSAGTFTPSCDLTGKGKAGNHLSFLLFVPKNPPSRSIPLILFLSGKGERGDDLTRQFRQPSIFGIISDREFQKAHPCCLLSVSPPESANTLSDGFPGEPSEIQKSIEGLVLCIVQSLKHPSVDTNQIYAVGFSFGGNGVFGLMTSFPGRFAAGIAVSAFPPPPVFAETGSPINIWNIFNEGDWEKQGLDWQMTEPFRKAVEKNGGEYRVSGFSKTGHNAWNDAWKEPSVWEWLFSKKTNFTSTQTGGNESPGKGSPFLLVCTSNMSEKSSWTKTEKAVDGLQGSAFESSGKIKSGDWIQVDFMRTVHGCVFIETGTKDGRNSVRRGQIETSVDGELWTKPCKTTSKNGIFRHGIGKEFRILRFHPDPGANGPLVVREIGLVP